MDERDASGRKAMIQWMCGEEPAAEYTKVDLEADIEHYAAKLRRILSNDTRPS